MRFFMIIALLVMKMAYCREYCGGARNGKKLQYVIGDAMIDSPDCLGPDGRPYPMAEVRSLLPRLRSLQGNSRRGRSGFASDFSVQSPEETRQELLAVHKLTKLANAKQHLHERAKRQASKTASDASLANSNSSDSKNMDSMATKDNNNQTSSNNASIKDSTNPVTTSATCESGESTPSRLCKSTFNTTAPMYGVSLTSGKPVTVVQIFPDLLQQVIYETCDSSKCDLIHGECVQTYVPYLFLVIPLGPVTLTGQDYVLVESGCTCRPKYAQPGTDPNPTSIIPNF